MSDFDLIFKESHLTRLDRKVSRAIVQGKGMRLTAEDLDLLAIIGAFALLTDAKAKALAEAARQRQEMKNSPG